MAKLAFIGIIILSFIQFQPEKTKRKELLMKANATFLNNDLPNAQKEYQLILAEYPDFGVAYFNLGNSLFKQNKLKESQLYYVKATENMQDSLQLSMAYHNLGNSLFLQNNYLEAFNQFKQALKLNPKDDATRYNFAVCQWVLKQQGRHPNQKKNKKYAYQLSEEVMEIIAESYKKIEEGDFKGAYEEMNQAILKDPKAKKKLETKIKKLDEIIQMENVADSIEQNQNDYEE